MIWQGEAKRASLCGGKLMATQQIPKGSPGLKYKEKNMKHNSDDGSTGTDMVFAELGVAELLRQDCRPSFIVDLMMEEENFELSVVFSNDAFKTYAGFRDVASWLSGNSCHSGEAFIKWIYTQPKIAVNQYWFRQQRWSKVLLEDRWCVISGHEMAFAKSTQGDTIHSQSLRSKPAQGRSFDLCANGHEIPFPFNQDPVPIQKAPSSFNPAMAAYAYFTPSPLSFETTFASFFSSKD
ncbi:926a8628-1038-48cf-be1c-6ecd4013da67 [Sclerotinia trifoliorum]|uniref:926a8628-1038-48cf-be1c-6ecd4013da67 n=1 Tax=Sclerotinia trifoliorum TaxID=28548 RepID=A0A8H2ZSJ4_9HELO|nr:926a8628-1038-48cf-be1c-6ecd4013da67 [Sclerotinia trifoliorum]